jgi:hypothetical protein
MSTRIRLLVVGAALAALSLFGVGTALAGNSSSESAGSVQDVQPVQQEQPSQDHDCPFGDRVDDVADQV